MQTEASESPPASSTSPDEVPPVIEHETGKLLFNTEAHNSTFQADLKAINKQHRDVYNRLHSISEDSEFVTQVVNRYRPLPVIANLRCGAWYIDPSNTTVDCTAYFKSTDGHDGQWQFSLRRSNLQLLHVIISSGGAILVDSTRRGKRYPDALSKTVPLWCAVLNAGRAKLLDRHPIAPKLQSAWQRHMSSTGLTTPVNAVRSSEHDQIQRLVDGWADQLLASSFNIEDTLAQLDRPLKPIWVSPASDLGKDSMEDSNALDFYPVICLSASKYLGDHASLDRAGGFDYIQGAGDDHEGWSRGLTPKLFWENRLQLLSANRPELDSLIDRIVSSSLDNTSSNFKRVEVFEVRATKLFICLPNDLDNNRPTEDELDVIISGGNSIELKCKKYKLENTVAVSKSRAMKNFSTALSSVLPDCTQMMRERKAVRLTAIGPNLNESKEMMVAIGLCLLVNVFDDQGLHRKEAPQRIEKVDVRHRLHWMIEASKGTINPPRSILKRVNNYLIG
ncbi:initiator tRNA phosphoribosyl transferase [Puccinia graminis f. sp. tritici CRL 75-36-700-3]|uniref:Initiator tRNA phosphoribosyl transferase n=1 Tax=Puccinia graminis f. sp. tritici (strain CRL 75-36-700-3 / race SCCL) TaxID=418459 RepID=E3KA19_PUCGT|nr:initiator tRNA phosphoribosyl transferase [Puccinia graminis f. sp. tritici CRL 75-36-700-3]EFP81001.2 initiator tRNA phosphoribosyl transferase [Puccinia graminis f. sp. tritici CRL 75-36-700-3]